MRLLTVRAGDAPPGGDPGHLRLCEPCTRRYTEDGRLAESVPGGPDAVVDLLEVDGDEAAALAAEDAAPPDPLLVVGSFTPLGGARTLGRFLVGGAVLDTNDFDGHRCPSEQTALGLWRIARLRGGAFWEGVAEVVAGWVESRVLDATGAGPVHSVWGEGETHVRFLADAALLLLAADRPAGAERAIAMLEGFGEPWGGGRWYAHDSIELARPAPDLVLNTHAQVLAVLAAAGRPVDEGRRALEAALALRPTGAARRTAVGGAVAVTIADLARASGIGRLHGGVDRRLARVGTSGEERVARAHRRGPFLRLPGGYLTRDASVRPAPHYYAAVNLYDLGVLVANGVVEHGGVVGRAFDDALRLAHRSGTFGALRRAGVGVAALEPIIWHQARRPARATAAAERLRRAGGALAPGSPGSVDAPWAAFSAGTA